jgi:hypothetical protein
MRDKIAFFDASYIPEPNSGCWLWTKGLFKAGYGSLYLNGRSALAHRFAWRLLKGKIPQGLCVCHKCDVRSCVNPDHLFVGTIADNNLDMEAKGRQRKRALRGEENPRSTLTKENVNEIKKRLATGERQIDLANEFNVSKTTICDIAHFRHWRGDR